MPLIGNGMTATILGRTLCDILFLGDPGTESLGIETESRSVSFQASAAPVFPTYEATGG